MSLPPQATAEEMRQREEAQKNGSQVSAVINVNYQTRPDGEVFANGLAVHFPEPPSPPAPVAPAPSLEQKLIELKSLREKNLITPEEYHEKRSELLKGL